MRSSNIIEGIDNSVAKFLSSNDETSGCKLVEKLEENLAILRLEVRQVEQINCDFESKLKNFNELTNSITNKLRSLMTLSQLRFGDGNEIKEFVEGITVSWLETNKNIIEDHSRIRVASRTSVGTSLSVLRENKKKEAAAIKISLEIGSVIYDEDYVTRGYKIYEEISQILESLERCDDKVQRYMVMCKTTPYLLDLSSSIDRFIRNIDLLPPSRTQSNDTTMDLNVFRILSKLLTGELLGLEATNPRQILAENAPRKPVFITLNTKRKIIEQPKVNRSVSFKSAFKSN